MTTALATRTENDPREAALLKAVGLDRVAPEARELAVNIAKRYDLDLLLKHLVLIDGKPFITRDALLYIAHRSGQFDGIHVTKPEVVDGYWSCVATVWRKDMSHSFEYSGRYPTSGGNQKFAPEMAIKVAESMALRRAFNVAAPVVEERWDTDTGDVPPPPPPQSLAERAAAKRAAIDAEPQEAAAEPPVEAEGRVDEHPAPDTGRVFAADAAAVPSAEPTAEPSAPRLTSGEFMAKLSASSIDQNHASTLRLVMFPDATVPLDDEQRGALWAQLEAEVAAAV